MSISFTPLEFEAALDHNGLKWRAAAVGVSMDDYWRLLCHYRTKWPSPNLGTWQDRVARMSGPWFAVAPGLRVEGGRHHLDGSISLIEHRL